MLSLVGRKLTAVSSFSKNVALPHPLVVVYEAAQDSVDATRFSVAHAARYAETRGTIASYREVYLDDQSNWSPADWLPSESVSHADMLVLYVRGRVFLAPDAVHRLVLRYLATREPCSARELGDDVWEWSPYTGELAAEACAVTLTSLGQAPGAAEMRPESQKILLGRARICEPAARWSRLSGSHTGMTEARLSVLIRMSGRSEEMLGDSLLGLQAQLAGCAIDLVVLAAGENRMKAKEIAGTYRGLEGSSPIRVVTPPPNFDALERLLETLAQNVVVFEDEDLVGEEWWAVLGSELRPGLNQPVRSPVRLQRVMPELWPSDQNGFRVHGVEGVRGEGNYSQVSHLVWDEVPLCGWVLQKSTLLGEEGLCALAQPSPGRDWALTLAAGFSGPPVIYCEAPITRRYWEGGDSGHLLATASFDSDDVIMLRALDAGDLCLRGGAVSDIRNLHDRANAAEAELVRLREIESSRYWRSGELIRRWVSKVRRFS